MNRLGNLVKQATEPPKDDRFLVYKGFCGNAPLFWTKGNAGYSADLQKAAIFTEKEADDIVSRNADLQKIKYADIENRIISVVWFN